MDDVLRIYVSSTALDLKEYRAAVIEALSKMEAVEVSCMEKSVAQDQLPVLKCLEDVGTCNIYAAILGAPHGK